MSKITFEPNASGTGVFTIASPNSNTDRTLNLPDEAGAVALTSNVFGYNIIVNGDGIVNQRGYVSGTATTGSNEYTLDRWRVVTSGESLAFTGNEAGRTMTAPSGGVEQVIEGRNIAGGTYAISWTGTATGAVDGTTVNSGDTVTLTANTNATIKFTNGTFTNVKVEKGDVATPFEHRSYGEELALCQRYFYKAASQLVYSADYGGGSFTRLYFPVTMRATPTVIATNNLTVLGAYHSTQSIQFYLNANAGYMDVNATADAEL